MKKHVILLLSIAFLVIQTAIAVPRTRVEIQRELESLVEHGAVLLADERGKILLENSGDHALVPASIIKILTAEWALETLGESYRFPTEFYFDKLQNLTIRGFGDPFLISEEIQQIAKKLKSLGIDTIESIQLDDHAFAPVEIPGQSQSLNPYDAINGALVVNFNTVFVGRQQNSTIYSAEKETPLTPLAKEKALQLGLGVKDRLNLTPKRVESLRYVGELFAAFLRENGITVIRDRPVILSFAQSGLQGTTQLGELVYTHQNSRDLPFILHGLLKYSNNFIANQIFLTVGAKTKGYPATIKKSQQTLAEYIKKTYNPAPQEMVVDEASGLSRENLITARGMLKVLLRFQKHASLLSVRKGAPTKSGTLTGIYNFAGYIPGPKGELYPYVILLEQSLNQRDRILNLLKKWVRL